MVFKLRHEAAAGGFVNGAEALVSTPQTDLVDLRRGLRSFLTIENNPVPRVVCTSVKRTLKNSGVKTHWRANIW